MGGGGVGRRVDKEREKVGGGGVEGRESWGWKRRGKPGVAEDREA